MLCERCIVMSEAVCLLWLDSCAVLGLHELVSLCPHAVYNADSLGVRTLCEF